MSLTIESVKADDMAAVLPALAQLRITVFRAFPYLYDGDLEYEQRYLDAFSKAPGAVIVVARDEDKIVGAATGAPMAQVEPEFAAPFIERGDALDKIFYCAESVLLPEYRGQGVGHAFFDHREAQALRLGASISCFCSVVRASDHLATPMGYRPLDEFWRKRGYAPMTGAQVALAWKDLGDDAETLKKLQVWSRSLKSALR